MQKAPESSDLLEPKKLALLRILQILRENSDASHPMTQEDIAEHLRIDYGIEVERKAIGRNLALLKESGVDIESYHNGSYIASREFKDSELHMLIDAVLSSRYISAEHSESLIKRISGLSNRYFSSHFGYVRSTMCEWSKTENQSLFLNIELVDEAIKAKRQISYDYNKYGTDKKLHKSSTQVISPFQMILHNQRYYLMGYSERHNSIVYHRMDHVTNMTMTETPMVNVRRLPGFENGISYKNLSSVMPYMYSDKPEIIEFLADKDIVDQVVDWFGNEARFSKADDERYVKVKIKASPSAMHHWATQYIDHVRVISPTHLVEKIRESLQSAVMRYKE